MVGNGFVECLFVDVIAIGSNKEESVTHIWLENIR